MKKPSDKRVSQLTANEVRALIRLSNERSAQSRAKYVLWENRAIFSDYEFQTCECLEACWCKRNGCRGHYRIKQIPFDAFLDTYVALWTPLSSRQCVKRAVTDGAELMVGNAVR